MPTTHPRHELRFAANLSWLYTDLPFLDRFEAAARDGFKGVECLFPHEHPSAEVAARLTDNGLQLVLFNAAPGNWAQGERGLACLDGREADFQASIQAALALAATLDCQRIHVMAGLCAPDDRDVAWGRYAQRLQWAADQARAHQCTLVIEPINSRDMPGYLLTHQAQAHELVQTMGSPHLQVQMDLYHCQIVEGDVSMRLRQYLPSGRVGHLQIAAVPDRGEPDRGELNYQWLFDELRQLKWAGWIGCEYRPRAGTSAGLGWLREQTLA
jgi:hydroxypyruvate isomerase